ncbi:hypothetical protein ACJJTC_006255 [Scirpophaga incertulas]
MNILRSLYWTMLVVISWAAAKSVDTKLEVTTAYNYHMNIGVGLAAKIKLAEKVGSQKIVGGAPTDISVTPYQAGLVIIVRYEHISVCGGFLISDTRVVTAAHCQWVWVLQRDVPYSGARL